MEPQIASEVSTNGGVLGWRYVIILIGIGILRELMLTSVTLPTLVGDALVPQPLRQSAQMPGSMNRNENHL